VAFSSVYETKDSAGGPDVPVELIPLEAVRWAADQTIRDKNLCREGEEARAHMMGLLIKRAWQTPPDAYARPGDLAKLHGREGYFVDSRKASAGDRVPLTRASDLNRSTEHAAALEIAPSAGKTWAPCKGYKP
jgi:hypothetical protein